MKRLVGKALSALTIALVSITLAASPALAGPPSRTTLRNAANAVAFEQVGGSNYAKYHKKYPSQLNWGHDGCSVPKSLAKYAKTYNKIFVNSCNRHDFGYRNFGKNTKTAGPHPKFSPTQLTKAKIDARFLANMHTDCTRKYSWYNPLRGVCNKVADIYYGAVALSPQGQRAFFG